MKMPPAPQVLETQLKQTKWRTLLLLALAVLLAKGVWFSASAVVPALTVAWNLTESGRAWLTMSVQIGFLFGGNPFVLVAICLIWGFSVVADSAQFSACITELSPREYIGTALTLQTSWGFLLTLRRSPAATRLAGGKG